MNRQQAYDLLPILDAYSKGKRIEFYNSQTRTWQDCEANGHEPEFIGGVEYRVKILPPPPL